MLHSDAGCMLAASKNSPALDFGARQAPEVGRRNTRGVAPMAQIVLGIGSAHSPQLQLSPEEWELRAEADRRNPEHWYRGRPYKFDELLEVRGANTFTHEITAEKKVARHAACQQAIAHLAETLDRV